MINPTSEKMHCLITGGAGYIGSHVANRIRSSNPNITVTIFDIKHDHDICKLSNLNQVFQDAQLSGDPITHVIHMAGLKSISESLLEPERYQAVNVEGTCNLIQVMKQYHVDNIIFSSSATVYKHDNQTSESDELQASNPYGSTKIQAEEAIKQSGLNYAIVRYFNPFGHLSGLDEDIQSSNLFPTLRRAILHNIPVCVFGNCERDYFFVDDLARFHVILLEDGFNHLIINFGTGLGTTTSAFIHDFEKANNVRLDLIHQPQRPGDKSRSIANTTKFNNLYPSFTFTPTLIAHRLH